MRDPDQPVDEAPDGERGHRHLHRPLALSDVVLGAGEADVGVLLLAGAGVERRLGVRRVPRLELLGLLAGLAEERAEDHPERVDRRYEGGDVADDVQRPVKAAAVGHEQQDLVLGEVAGERGYRRQRQTADHEAGEREGKRATEARHPVQRLLARHGADDRPGQYPHRVR